VFQKRALPDDMVRFAIGAGELDNGAVKLFSLLVRLGFADASGEARRTIRQGAVRLNGVKQEDPGAEIFPQEGDVIQVGRRRFAKLNLS